jgi:site-specific DNA recombinase
MAWRMTRSAAMRAYAEETNRLNRERRLSADTTRRELADTEKAIKEIVRVIEQGGYHRALSDRLTELETKRDDLTVRLSRAPLEILASTLTSPRLTSAGSNA